MTALFKSVKGGHREGWLVTGKPTKAVSTQISAKCKMLPQDQDSRDRDATGTISRDHGWETLVRPNLIVMTQAQLTDCTLRKGLIPLPDTTCLSLPAGSCLLIGNKQQFKMVKYYRNVNMQL